VLDLFLLLPVGSGRVRRRCPPSLLHPSLRCSSCYSFAFPWPLERFTRSLCPRNEDHKPSKSDRHSPTPVLFAGLPGKPAATPKGSFTCSGRRASAGLCCNPTFHPHRAVVVTWATELLPCYTQPKCGCCCPLLGCTSLGFRTITGVMRTGCSRHPLTTFMCCRELQRVRMGHELRRCPYLPLFHQSCQRWEVVKTIPQRVAPLLSRYSSKLVLSSPTIRTDLLYGKP